MSRYLSAFLPLLSFSISKPEPLQSQFHLSFFFTSINVAFLVFFLHFFSNTFRCDYASIQEVVSVRPYVRISRVFKSKKSLNYITINVTMTNNKLLASDVPSRYLLFCLSDLSICLFFQQHQKCCFDFGVSVSS